MDFSFFLFSISGGAGAGENRLGFKGCGIKHLTSMSASIEPAADRSTSPQRYRAERVQQMRVELAAHLFHGRKGLGVSERQPIGALLHQRRIDIHDGGEAHDVADLIAPDRKS